MGMMDAVILTKSAMHKHGKSGACVTAYDPAENRFVRFVWDKEGAPIPYAFSNRFSLLDWVRVNVICPCPLEPQTENLLVEARSFFRIGPYVPGIAAIFNAAPPPPFPRFMDDNGYKLDSVDIYHHSLELIYVTDLCIEKQSYKGDVRGKASFDMGTGRRRFFSVTDPRFDIRKVNQDRLEIGGAYMVMSIPTEEVEINGQKWGYFKFIASIYPI